MLAISVDNNALHCICAYKHHSNMSTDISWTVLCVRLIQCDTNKTEVLIKFMLGLVGARPTLQVGILTSGGNPVEILDLELGNCDFRVQLECTIKVIFSWTFLKQVKC